MKTKNSIGYIRILKEHRALRNLWYGQVVSELGDWINSIAIYTIILKVTGSGMAMAAAMMAKLLPMVLVSPFAGVIIDRINRRTVMIISDVFRFFIVLGLLMVEGRETLWLLYTLTILEVCMSGFFEPARSAIIPSIIPKKDLVTANALCGSTWSVMLAFGAALGGFLVSLLGIRTAIILDALTFLLSAWFIFQIPSPKTRDDWAGVLGQSKFKELMEGGKYLLSEPIILVLSLLKPGLSVAGGIMTLIPLYAHQFLASPAGVSMGIGVLYSARGFGAAIGPVLVKSIFGESSKTLQIAIAAGFFLGAGSFLFFAEADSMWTASLGIGAATLFGSIIWVFSSALLHLEAEDKFLGRVFGTEMALLTLIMGISNGGVGYAIDQLHMTPNEVAFWMAGLFLIPGILWSGFVLFVHRRLKQGKCVGSYCPIDPSGFNPLPPSTGQNR